MTATDPTPELPSRFFATPAQVDAHLRAHFAEDVLLAYQQAIGHRSVAEASKGLRMEAARREAIGEVTRPPALRDAANFVDPAKSAGPFPSSLIKIGGAL